MIEENCKCTMSQSMVGDGCKICQPRTYIAHLEDALESADIEIAQLEDDLADARKYQDRYQYVIDWLESKVIATAAFTHARTKSEYDQAIDAAIKDQQ